jgi:hypothetical protein
MGELQFVIMGLSRSLVHGLRMAATGGPDAGHGLVYFDSALIVRPCSVNSSTLEEELFVKTINWPETHSYVAWVMLSCVSSRRLGGPTEAAILPSPQHV